MVETSEIENRDRLPVLMGVLNVTSDSFSDGGKFRALDDAVLGAVRMVEEGADIIDVGGESTRPGSHPVSLEEELGRVLPVVEALTSRGVFVSVDTSKPEVARQSLRLGARMINDVGGLRDPKMIGVCAELGARVCIVHMQGLPSSMQHAPAYENVVAEVKEYLLAQAELAIAAGIPPAHIVLDPGIGFGKTVDHNLTLIRDIGEFVTTGFPVLLGVSRKGFLGWIMGSDANPAPVLERQEGTLAIQTYAQLQGVSIFRTHDVSSARKTAKMVAAIVDAGIP